jgi:hypothetical protein
MASKTLRISAEESLLTDGGTGAVFNAGRTTLAGRDLIAGGGVCIADATVEEDSRAPSQTSDFAFGRREDVARISSIGGSRNVDSSSRPQPCSGVL